MRIAVTGGVGEGKSTVLSYVREAGVTTASADEAARAVFEEAEVQERLSLASGLKAPIGRDALGKALAERPDLRRAANRIMHRPILERLLMSDARVLEIPLLIETCLQGSFDRIWVVTCGPDEQLRRLAERLGDPAAARRLISAQLRTSAKESFADVIVRTNREEADVREFVVEALHREND